MARVTVEDCLNHVDNRFELVLLASKRARQLVSGKEPTLEWQNDKPMTLFSRFPSLSDLHKSKYSGKTKG